MARVTVELGVPARMRDGVTLATNVYLPEGPGPLPVLVMRTPYGKDRADEVHWCGLDPVQVASRGFVVVIQDTRGRYASEGDWEPLAREREDGYDTVEWAARLPGSNGRVGMYGGSYCGSTQWQAAIEQPPSLAAISPLMTWSDPMDGLFARGGAVELGLALPWALMNGIDHLDRLADKAEVEGVIDELDLLRERGFWDLPVEDGGPLGRHAVPELGSIGALGDPTIAARSNVVGSHHLVQVPSFHVGGWYDALLQGTLDNYEAMAALGREARLVVGPWTHEAFADPIGEELFGVRAARDEVVDLQVRWMAHHLRADDDLPEAPVRIFTMGRNAWRDESSWPPAGTVTQRRFLRAGGALTLEGPQPDEPPSEFTYDPAEPVPTIGGHLVMPPAFASGPFDQRPIESRADVCVFTSDPLDAELEVTGRVRVVLHAESSAPSTDWVARLCDVHPDGRSINLCDGIVRVAGGVRHEIDLWSTSNAFLRGHCLRVHVTSSSFPRWDRNLNTGNQREPRFEVARQRVHHDASYIELPVRT